MPKRLAYLGPPGTFTEEAALQYDREAHLVPFLSIPAVAEAVQRGMADEGVVPIENSLEGSVTDTMDLLIQEVGLFIRRELVLPVEHCLMVKPGTQTEEIEVVYSHPQALAQCRRFLERCFPRAQRMASLSTAAAVEEMLRSTGKAAAVGTRRAGQLYGAEVLAHGIQDSAANVTRFVILSTTDHEPTGAGKDKTSLCFSFSHDRPGLLYGVMSEFASRKINLARVESRPTKETLGRYIFLIDLDGHRLDPLVREALDSVRGQVGMLRIFGSYPRWQGAAHPR
ncbi:MAG: prephenate dehydratase [Dehalococcoidia bacterium]|nr:prephenate dehydratase [Dehalococcoidia bacterium]